MRHLGRFRTLLGGLAFLTCSNCAPVNYLQYFNTRMITNSGRIHIESGRKERHVELGLSYSAGLPNDKAEFSSDGYYDFERLDANYDKVNETFKIPNQRISLFGSIMGEKLASGQGEVQIAYADGHYSYDVSGGGGVRLYRGRIAGRAFLSGGVMSTSTSVYVFRVTDEADTDLIDTYDEFRPYIALTLDVNSRSPRLFVKPVGNVKFRCSPLFHYDDISLFLLDLTGTFGVYRSFGPMTACVAVQITHYLSELSRIAHPELLTQMTFTIARRRPREN